MLGMNLQTNFLFRCLAIVAVATFLMTGSVLAADPTASPSARTQGITPVVQGGSLKFDLANFSSGSLAISIVSETMTARTLLTVPLLSDAIGMTVPIPTDIAPGRYNLVVTGVDKGEQLTIPIEVQGIPTNSEPNLPRMIMISFGLTAIAVLLVARRHGSRTSRS